MLIIFTISLLQPWVEDDDMAKLYSRALIWLVDGG